MNILLILIGFGLGMIGYDKWIQAEILTFNSHLLYQGLPMIVVVIILLGLPGAPGGRLRKKVLRRAVPRPRRAKHTLTCVMYR